MAVSKDLKLQLEAEFGRKVDSSFSTISLPKIQLPKLATSQTAKNVANQSQYPVGTGMQMDRTEQLKQELSSLPYEARMALRKNAFVDQNGMINLPSVDNADLNRFEGLQISQDEWAKNYQAIYTGGSKGTTIGPGTGKEQLINSSRTLQDKYKEFILYTEDLRNTQERNNQRTSAYESAGLDYITRLNNAQRTTRENPYEDFSWSNPLTYLNPLFTVGAEYQSAFTGAGMDAIRGFAGSIESMSGSDPYFKWARDIAARVNDDFAVRKDNTDLVKSFSEQKSFFAGGAFDPSYYYRTIGSIVPHVLGLMGASITGGALAGPVGGFAGALAYGSTVETGSMYNDLLDLGVPLSEARRQSQIYGAIAGSLDSLVPGKIGGKVLSTNVKKMLGEHAKITVKQQFLKGGLNILKEGTTEAGQEFVNNVMINHYDKTRGYWDNLPDAFIGGLIGGAMFSGFDQKGESIIDPNYRGVPPRDNAQQFTPEPQSPGQEPQRPQAPTQQEEQYVPETPTPDMSTSDIEQSIDTLLEQARADNSAVQIGQKILEMEGDSPVVEKLIEQSREQISNLNTTAKLYLEESAKRSAESIVSTPNVEIKVGTTTDGKFIASGDMSIGGESFMVNFDADFSSDLKGEAIASVVNRMNVWFADKLSNEGISNEAEVDAVFKTLEQVQTEMMNPESFVSQNIDNILRAQDFTTAEDFARSMSDTDSSINSDMDLKAFFKRANNADSVYLTKDEAKRVVDNLVGDLGIEAKYVGQVSTNPKALGRFAQSIAKPMGWIEMRDSGDATQLGDRNIRLSTPYHEVAHAYFRNLVDAPTQKEILDSVRENEGKENLTDAQAEEVLAEDLKKFVFEKEKATSKYGKVLAKLIDYGKRMLRWLGNMPMDKSEQFYRDVLAKKRPSERQQIELDNKKREFLETQMEYYQDPTSLTSKFFKHKEITGKEFVSYQQVKNALKGAGLKQAEFDIINAVLDTEFKDEKRISVSALEDAIVSELVPLEVKDSKKYAEYGLDNVGMDNWESTTHIYDSPVEHGISGHFSGETTKLFGHTRIATDGDTRAILEVQSDFFQKTRGGSMQLLTPSDFETLVSMVSGIKEEPDFGGVREVVKNAPNDSVAYHFYQAVKEAKGSGDNWSTQMISLLKKRLEVEKLMPYANIWHERMIKEEIRLAAMDGIKTLRVPTGSTIAHIEGYVGGTENAPYTVREENRDVDILPIGSIVETEYDTYYVFESDNSMIRVASLSEMDTPRDVDVKVEVDYYGEGDLDTMYYDPTMGETWMQPGQYKKGGASFKADMLQPEQKAVYDFYKSKVNPYFKKLRKDAREITDENGFTWLETDIATADSGAVEAFQTEGASKPSVWYHGTSQRFDAFDTSMLNASTNTLAGIEGFWLTSSPDEAASYAELSSTKMTKNQKEWDDKERQLQDRLDTATRSRDYDAVDSITEEIESHYATLFSDIADPVVMGVSVNTLNTKTVNMIGESGNQGQLKEIIAQAKSEGYDSVLFKSISDNPKDSSVVTDQMIVFDPSMLNVNNLEAFQEQDFDAFMAEDAKNDAKKKSEISIDEMDLPEPGRLNGKKFTSYKQFPAEEGARYVAYFKALQKAQEKAQTSSDPVELQNSSRVVASLYKYDEYLLRTYGIGLDEYSLALADNTVDAVYVNMATSEDAGVVDGFKVDIAKDIARLLNILPQVARVIGVDVKDISAVDFDTAMEYTRRAKQSQNYYKLSDSTRDIVESLDRYHFQSMIHELGKVDDNGDLVNVDDNGVMDEYMALAQSATTTKGTRIRVSDIVSEYGKLDRGTEAMMKNREKAELTRKRLVNMRVKMVERREYEAKTRAERGVKRRIHEQIMRREDPTVEMTESELRKFQYQQQAKGADAGVKATRKLLQEKYREAKLRQGIMQKILSKKKRLSKAISEGRMVDVETGKKLKELFDTFEKSAVSQKTIDLLNTYLQQKKANAEAKVGTITNDNEYTADDAKAEKKEVDAILKRIGRKALSQMNTEDMNVLLSTINTLAEEGMVRLGLIQYMSEVERQKKIDEVLKTAVNLDDPSIMSTIMSKNEKRLVKEGNSSTWLELLSPSAVANKLDGRQMYDGKQSQIVKSFGVAETGYVRESQQALDKFFVRIKEEVGINEFTEQESSFITYHIRLNESEGGAYLAERIAEEHYPNGVPEMVGKVSAQKAEQIVSIMQDTLVELDMTDRVSGTFEATTNKPFPKMKNYLMVSKFVNAPNAWVTDGESFLDMQQGYGRNSTSINFGSAKERKASSKSLRPRTDFMRLFADTIDTGLYYVYMQPVLNNAKSVVGSTQYEMSAGKIASKWWKDYMAVVSGRGTWENSPRYAQLDKIRNNVTVALLAFRPSTVVMQASQLPFGMLFAHMKYGPMAGMRVLAETMKMFVPGLGARANALRTSDALFARSGTAGNMGVQDLQRSIQRQAFEEKNVYESFKYYGAKYGMWLMQELDTSLYAGTRQGIYETLLAEGVDETQAGIDADYITNIAQSSTQMTDRPIFIAKGGSVTKFLTALQTFSLGFFSMYYEGIVMNGMVKGDLTMKARAIPVMIAMPLISAMIINMAREVTGLLTGREDEEDENLLVQGLKDLGGQFPVLGPILRGMIDFGKSGIDTPGTGMLQKLVVGSIELVSSDDKIKAFIKATEGGASLAGIPMIAPMALMAQRITRSESDNIKFASMRRSRDLSFTSMSTRDIDDVVYEVSNEVYGEGKVEDATLDKIRKQVIKQVAKRDNNSFVKDIAQATKNEDKAYLLIEASRTMDVTDYTKMVNALRRNKILSDAGYKEYLKIKAGQ